MASVKSTIVGAELPIVDVTLQDEGLSSVTAGQKRYPSIAGANID